MTSALASGQARKSPDPARSVFINCPFDAAYRRSSTRSC